VFGFSREQPSTSGQKASHGHWEAIVLDIGAGKIDREETTTRLRNLLKWRRRWTAKR
jgi:hypothetical protein